MPNFVVERYRSSSDPTASGGGGQAHGRCPGRKPGGTHVRYVSTIFLPGDETCLYLFEADSEADVLAVPDKPGSK